MQHHRKQEEWKYKVNPGNSGKVWMKMCSGGGTVHDTFQSGNTPKGIDAEKTIIKMDNPEVHLMSMSLIVTITFFFGFNIPF